MTSIPSSAQQGMQQQQPGGAGLYEPAMFASGVSGYNPQWPPAIGQPHQLQPPGGVSLPGDVRMSQHGQQLQQQSFSDAGVWPGLGWAELGCRTLVFHFQSSQNVAIR